MKDAEKIMTDWREDLNHITGPKWMKAEHTCVSTGVRLSKFALLLEEMIPHTDDCDFLEELCDICKSTFDDCLCWIIVDRAFTSGTCDCYREERIQKAWDKAKDLN